MWSLQFTPFVGWKSCIFAIFWPTAHNSGLYFSRGFIFRDTFKKACQIGEGSLSIRLFMGLFLLPSPICSWKVWLSGERRKMHSFPKKAKKAKVYSLSLPRAVPLFVERKPINSEATKAHYRGHRSNFWVFLDPCVEKRPNGCMMLAFCALIFCVLCFNRLNCLNLWAVYFVINNKRTF